METECPVETGNPDVVLLHAAIDFQGRPSCQGLLDVVLWFVVVRTLTGVASLVCSVASLVGNVGSLVVSSGRLGRCCSTGNVVEG